MSIRDAAGSWFDGRVFRIRDPFFTTTHPQFRRELRMLIRRVKQKGVVSSSASGLCDESFKKKYPDLWDWLASETYGDGTKRLLGKMAVKVQDGKFLGTLSDEDAQACTFVSAATFELVLKCLNAAVTDDTARWVSYNRTKTKK